MDFTPEFEAAFHHAMIYEVGAFWDPSDPEVISGACETAAQRKKVGYVNIPEDTGGLTKYGVAQNPNPSVDVQNLDLKGAMEVYFKNYWLPSKCNLITIPIKIFHFDAAVNHGVGRAAKFLQQAVGVVVDGAIGPVTLAAVNKQEPAELIKKLSTARSDFYHSIVQNKPSQAKFLKGWLRRNNEVTQYSLESLSK